MWIHNKYLLFPHPSRLMCKQIPSVPPSEYIKNPTPLHVPASTTRTTAVAVSLLRPSPPPVSSQQPVGTVTTQASPRPSSTQTHVVAPALSQKKPHRPGPCQLSDLISCPLPPGSLCSCCTDLVPSHTPTTLPPQGFCTCLLFLLPVILLSRVWERLTDLASRETSPCSIQVFATYIDSKSKNSLRCQLMFLMGVALKYKGTADYRGSGRAPCCRGTNSRLSSSIA